MDGITCVVYIIDDGRIHLSLMNDDQSGPLPYFDTFPRSLPAIIDYFTTVMHAVRIYYDDIDDMIIITDGILTEDQIVLNLINAGFLPGVRYTIHERRHVIIFARPDSR